MTYEEARDEAQCLELDAAIDVFISRCPPPAPATVRRQTLILLLGGAGSQLKRTRGKYSKGDDPSKFSYDTVWLNCQTLLGAALRLRMKRSGSTWVESDGHIVVAGGSVEFLHFTPYDGFVAWCTQRNIDVLCYGYDWRRPFDEMADFFVTRFLPRFQRRVLKACGFDPLADYALVGHSQGGMLLNWIVRQHGATMPAFSKAITVAAPFYGYGGQVARWFAGEPLLNQLGKDKMIRVISSFPAMYALNFMAWDTYLANRAGFEADKGYELMAYPSVDYATGTVADPYDPKTNGLLVRYPSRAVTDFDRRALDDGGRVARAMAAPMAAKALSSKFFNVRGVQTRGLTVGSSTWRWIQADFDPSRSPSPIHLIEEVPGDGTQPAWTARLLRDQNDGQAANIITVVAEDAEHMFIMESGPVQDQLAKVLGVPERVSDERRKSGELRIASSGATLLAVRAMQVAFSKDRNRPFEIPEAELRDYWRRKRVLKDRLAMARRILIDLVRPLPAARTDYRHREKRRGKA